MTIYIVSKQGVEWNELHSPTRPSVTTWGKGVVSCRPACGGLALLKQYGTAETYSRTTNATHLEDVETVGDFHWRWRVHTARRVNGTAAHCTGQHQASHPPGCQAAGECRAAGERSLWHRSKDVMVQRRWTYWPVAFAFNVRYTSWPPVEVL